MEFIVYINAICIIIIAKRSRKKKWNYTGAKLQYITGINHRVEYIAGID